MVNEMRTVSVFEQVATTELKIFLINWKVIDLNNY